MLTMQCLNMYTSHMSLGMVKSAQPLEPKRTGFKSPLYH